MQEESEHIASTTEYGIDPEGRPVSEYLRVHREVGESEFGYVLVGSNPDATATTDRDESERIAFGFHKDELTIPLPAEEGEEEAPDE